MKLVHVHKLETLYLFCGVTGQSGVIWVVVGQIIILIQPL